jgi:hypothetical protein
LIGCKEAALDFLQKLAVNLRGKEQVGRSLVCTPITKNTASAVLPVSAVLPFLSCDIVGPRGGSGLHAMLAISLREKKQVDSAMPKQRCIATTLATTALQETWEPHAAAAAAAAADSDPAHPAIEIIHA